MNTYECMYILQTNLSDDETQKANRRIVEEIEKRGGSMHQRDRLGKKRLAYRIGRHDDGVYHLMYFELPPDEIASLRAAYRLHPRLLRFMILRKEPEDVPKVQKRAPREAAKQEAAPEKGPETAPEEDAAAAEKPAEAPSEAAEGEPEAAEPPAERSTEEAPAGAGPEAEPEKQE